MDSPTIDTLTLKPPGYTQPARPLNHAEIVYRPGERLLARRAFEAMGCKVSDSGSVWISADEVFLLSEVTEEQWEFEQWLAEQLAATSDATRSPFIADMGVRPQRYSHLGIGRETLAEWEAAVERIQHLPETDEELAGRLHVAAVFRPGDAGSYGDDLVQAFVRTDIFSIGALALGQTIELQHYYDNDPARDNATDGAPKIR